MDEGVREGRVREGWNPWATQVTACSDCDVQGSCWSSTLENTAVSPPISAWTTPPSPRSLLRPQTSLAPLSLLAVSPLHLTFVAQITPVIFVQHLPLPFDSEFHKGGGWVCLVRHLYHLGIFWLQGAEIPTQAGLGKKGLFSAQVWNWLWTILDSGILNISHPDLIDQGIQPYSSECGFIIYSVLE